MNRRDVASLVVSEDADALMRCIESELSETDFFTREDLLHVSAFADVATITRYRYVCDSVHFLLLKKKLIAVSRTDLCVPGKAKSYDRENPIHEQYLPTVRRLAVSIQGRFGVMDVLQKWTRTDQHLTQNAKRVAVRNALRKLRRDGVLERVDRHQYRRTKDA
jgi:hypothetical protein